MGIVTKKKIGLFALTCMTSSRLFMGEESHQNVLAIRRLRHENLRFISYFMISYTLHLFRGASVMRIRINLIHPNRSDGLPGGAKVGTKNGAYHTLCFSTRVFLTSEIFSPHVPKCNVCGEMLLSSHITLTFLITPHFLSNVGL